MKKYIYLMLLLCGVILASCSDDYLEEFNKNGLNSDTFMELESQAVEATTAIYDPLNHKGLFKYGFLVTGEAPTDNVINDWGDGRTGPDVVAIYNYNWSDTNQFFLLRWNACYKGINRANYLLENLDKVTDFSLNKEEELKGQALFLRALYYFNLVSGFGDVPLVTTLLSSDESNNIMKSPEADVWAQMDLDLTLAASLLPESYPTSEVGRATKGAAYGLLSRVRIWTKDFKGAAEAAAEVEKLNYQLLAAEDYGKMFDGRMENSSESVFETQLVSGFGSYWHSENAETTELMSLFPRISWAQYIRPRKTDTYDIVSHFEANDIRREATILISGQDQIFYVGANKMSVFPDLDIHSDFREDLKVPGAYQTRKFLPYDTNNWKKGGAYFNQGASINIPVIRYAEVILNRAEALAEQNKLSEAWVELEKIRTRAGLSMVGVSDSDKEALLDQIKKDRRVELMFEGHRWGDLKRWGELGSLTAAGLSYSGQQTWPIPSQEKSINPNL